MGYSENQYLLFTTLIILCFFIIFVALYFTRVVPFRESKKYIKMEIKRSKGRERKFWERELKKLYVLQIPIFGKAIEKLIR